MTNPPACYGNMSQGLDPAPDRVCDQCPFRITCGLQEPPDVPDDLGVGVSGYGVVCVCKDHNLDEMDVGGLWSVHPNLQDAHKVALNLIEYLLENAIRSGRVDVCGQVDIGKKLISIITLADPPEPITVLYNA